MRNAFRTPKCECCGKPLAIKQLGRRRQYCSSRCRSVAQREREWNRFASARYPNKAAARNDSRNGQFTGISQRQKRKLVRQIIEIEIGGMIIRPGSALPAPDADATANDNQPAQRDCAA